MHRSLTAIFLTPFILLAACSGTDEPPVAEPIPVIEAWIDCGGYPVVLFNLSVDPEQGGSLADNMIRWGKVTISDGSHEAILTGGPDTTYLPPYRYFTTEIVGTPGATYTLTATYKGISASAECVMPPAPTPIDSITLSPVDGTPDLKAATLWFTAPDDVPAWYYVTVSTPGARSVPALLGYAETTVGRRSVAVPVNRPRQMSLTPDDYTPYFHSGDSLVVTLCRVRRDAYEFWRAFNDMQLFSGSIFVTSATSLPGNINGGLGIFAARATTSARLAIP